MRHRASEYYQALKARRKLAREPRSVRLFARDDERVHGLAARFNEDISEMIRNLVHEALNTRDRRAAERARAIESGGAKGGGDAAALEAPTALVAELQAVRSILNLCLQTGVHSTSMLEGLPEYMRADVDDRQRMRDRSRREARETAAEAIARVTREELEQAPAGQPARALQENAPMPAEGYDDDFED